MCDYEWDEGKRRENREKHGVDFAAIGGFDWDGAVYNESRRRGEQSWEAAGYTGYIGCRLRSAVYTVRGGKRRIISLRKANPREMRNYAAA